MFSSTQIEALRARVGGRVFAPLDDGYDAARRTWNVAMYGDIARGAGAKR